MIPPIFATTTAKGRAADERLHRLIVGEPGEFGNRPPRRPGVAELHRMWRGRYSLLGSAPYSRAGRRCAGDRVRQLSLQIVGWAA